MSGDPSMLEQEASIAARAADASAIVANVERKGSRVSVATAGGAVVWRVWGEGRPLVLVHGGGGSWTHWLRNIEELAAHRRVFALDLPGCGESQFDKTPDEPRRIALSLRCTLVSVVGEAVGLDFVTFSFGGIVSGHLAIIDPAVVGSLTLVGAVGLGVARLGRPPLERLAPTMSIVERWDRLRRNLEAMMIADPDRVDDLAIYLQDRNTSRTRLRSGIISATDPLAGLLGRLQCPVRALWGRQDNLYPQDVRERAALFARLQHPSEPVFIDPGGHWVQFERSDAFNRWLMSSLDHGDAR